MAEPKRIVAGQRVDRRKQERAKELRRSMTPQERKLWGRLRTNQLDGLHFRRQQIIDGFIIDFYCHAAALAIEVDGPVHEHQADYDAERTRWLAARGLRTLRISNAEIDTDFDAVLERIRSMCRTQLLP